MRVTEQERNEALQRLRDWLKPGDTVYTVCRHVSKSGMQRTIGVVLIKHEQGKVVVLHPNHAVSKLLGYPIDKDRDGIKVGGCGMDMGFYVVYSLSRTLFPEGNNGRDGGYALAHQWL